MTTIPDSEIGELVERLRETYETIYFTEGLHNRDGPEAADTLATLATERDAALDRVKVLEGALQAIDAEEYPKRIGQHEYSTFGEATGNEYKHKFGIYESAHVVVGRLKEIARVALAHAPKEAGR